MSVSPQEPTVLIVDSLPLRNLGLVSVLDRLSGAKKFRIASLTPEDAERWIDADARCSMIIYNVGGASVAEHKHAKQIRALRARAADAPLVIFSDNDSREEVFSAFRVGAQGFLYAGTNAELALQALSFIFKGGSYFPANAAAKHRRANRRDGAMTGNSPAAEWSLDDVNDADEHAGATGSNNDLTDRQKSVLERLGHGDSNKGIARHLGIREGTVKVHVRQIMRKLGVTNRTQVAIACAHGSGPETSPDDRGIKGK